MYWKQSRKGRFEYMPKPPGMAEKTREICQVSRRIEGGSNLSRPQKSQENCCFKNLCSTKSRVLMKGLMTSSYDGR
jgi:hypothetical protein